MKDRFASFLLTEKDMGICRRLNRTRDLFKNPIGYFTSLANLLFLSGYCLKTEVFKQL
jgi:hypothetical protein